MQQCIHLANKSRSSFPFLLFIHSSNRSGCANPRFVKHNAIIGIDSIDMSGSDVEMVDADLTDADASSDSQWIDIPDFDQTDTPGANPTDTSDPHRYGRLPKTLGSLYVAQRPTITLNRISSTLFDQGCTICLTAFDSKESTRDVVQMGCIFGHCFDRECINEWLSEEGANQNTCPMCRKEFFEKREEEGEGEEDEEYDDDEEEEEAEAEEAGSDLEDEWEWPRYDDGSLQWLANFVDLKSIRTDLQLYAELHRVEVLPIALDPAAMRLNHQEELALLQDIRRRQGYRPTSAHVTNDEYLKHLEGVRLIEDIRLKAEGRVRIAEAWLLYWAFPG